MVPHDIGRARCVDRHARAGGQIVEQVVGVGEGVESAVRFVGGALPCRPGSCAGAPSRRADARTLHSARGLGVADGVASQNLYSPSGVCVSSVS